MGLWGHLAAIQLTTSTREEPAEPSSPGIPGCNNEKLQFYAATGGSVTQGLKTETVILTFIVFQRIVYFIPLTTTLQIMDAASQLGLCL